MSNHDRSRCLTGRVVAAISVSAACSVLWPAAPAAATTDPLDGTGPSSTGLPGGELVQQILSWGQWLGMAACALAILYGAGTWVGFGSASAGRAMSGKTYVVGGGAGLLIIGLLPTIVSLLFDAGRS